MELLKNIRAYEDVYFEDPEENPDTPRFRVWFDDKHIEEYLAKVGTAIDRAQANEQMAREADTPEKVAEANAAQTRLMKRTVSAFIGTEGWEELLAWMGGDEGPIVPEENIRILGEVFAAFLNMLARHATSEQLIACGLAYEDRARAGACAQPRPAPRQGQAQEERQVMLPAALTAERVRLPDGTSATRYPWNGEDVLVRDDALTIIRVIGVLTDDGMTDEQRRDEFLTLFFVDWTDAWCACDYDAAEFVRMRDAAVWDICGLDLTGNRPHETPLWDLEEDAARIRISFRQAYGIEWDEVRGRISFAEFVALVGGCPQDTPLGAAIHYRNPATKPKPTKYNRQEVEAWNAAHKAFELGKGRSSHGSEEGSDAAMRDVFAALKRATR